MMVYVDAQELLLISLFRASCGCSEFATKILMCCSINLEEFREGSPHRTLVSWGQSMRSKPPKFAFIFSIYYTHTHMYIWYAPVLAPDREFCESEVRGKYSKPPTSSWCVLVTPLTLARCGSGKRPSGGALAVVAADRGGDRRCNRHHMCFMNTARTDG